MQLRRRRFPRRVLAALAPLLFGALAVEVSAAQTAPYATTDQIEGEWVSYNAVPIRPMALTADSADLYAVSTQANAIVHVGGVGTERFATPRSPVSVAFWDDDLFDGTPESRLVVACRDSYTVVQLDRLTGETVALLEVRDPSTGAILGEPQDLLVDQNTDTAFVSCAASDAVAEIDLVSMSVTRVFLLPSKNPVFMCFDGNGDVLVAPMLSGNNSGARRTPELFINPQHFGPTVVDFAAQGIEGTRLPDEDLFRCVRSTGAVQAVTTAVGAIQFGVAIHPSSGDVWQLNTSANNKDPQRQGEAAIRGDFVRNRVSISTLNAVGDPARVPHTIVDLDQTNPSIPFDTTRTVGQPYALAFVGNLVAIAGLLTDNVMVLDSQGDFVLEFDLPDGSIPRGLLYSAALNRTFVYCWGTNKVETYIPSLSPTHDATIDLGHDPTPARVKRGREIFYDASHSKWNNSTCVSCHIEGRMDQLVWNLGDLPTDDKGPLLTQPLVGVERVTPFHWRGEKHRKLADFNSAFVSLHGASKALSPSDFADFQSFVFSMQNTPNVVQNESRVIDDTIRSTKFVGAPQSHATLGKPLFKQECEVCHNLPLGSGNDIFGDGAVFDEQNPRRQRYRIPPFRNMFRRQQDADPIAPGLQGVEIKLMPLASSGARKGVYFNADTLLYPVLGAGFGHAGLALNVHGRVIPFALTDQQIADVTDYLWQFDSGIAPATWRTTLLDQANHTIASAELSAYLVPQADARNCDIAVYGTSQIAAVPTAMRWFYDRDTGLFVPEDTSVASQALSFFTGQALAGEGSNVFVGLPVGMGERFAVDYDGDDLYNADEAALGTNPFDADTDEDGWPDGHEVKNGGNALASGVGSVDTTNPTILRSVTPLVTGTVARINVETDEPCRVRIEYSRAGGGLQVKASDVFAKTHSVLLNDLLHSTSGNPWMTYTGTVTAIDHAGRTSSVGLPTMPDYNLNEPDAPPGPITTRNFRTLDKSNLIGELAWTSRAINRGRNGLTARAKVRVDRVNGGPPGIPVDGVRVIARLFKNNEQVAAFRPLGTTTKLASFDWVARTGAVLPFTGLPGPFLLSAVTGADGEVEFGFSLRGLAPGDALRLNIEMIVEQDNAFSSFTIKALDTWSMPATAEANRGLETQL